MTRLAMTENKEKKPLPRRAHLITPRGEQQLQDELDFLWRKDRPVVTQQVSDAAKLGDRSENAEYIYGKKRLREIDRRVRYLRKRLEICDVIDRPPLDVERVYFGAWIELEDDNEELYRYRIVGEDEIDLPNDYISVDAPLARGLLGKRLDDEVDVMLPKGQVTYCIVAIHYQKPEWDQKTWYQAPSVLKFNS
jgi:transcription elongation factor GreB|tara:strand:- start:12664 stop:13242 length:579 start_codon:yes stop_codon:yes gene_type:complete